MQDGVAKPEDFRSAFEQREKAVRVTLPVSGLPVLARRLSPLRLMIQSDRLQAINLETATAEERVEFARIYVSTIQEILIEPRLSLTPGPNEIDPNWLPEEDAQYLFKWGVGVIADDSSDLAPTFRRPRAPAPCGAARGDVALPPERDPGDRRSHVGTPD